MLIDAGCFSLMMGLGETYFPAFTLAIGGGELAAGLVTTLPMLIGALLQLSAPAAVRAVRSNRRWVVLCVSLQATSFVPLVAAAWHGGFPVLGMFVLASLYWAAGQGSGGAWSTWVGSIIPRRIRAPFFAWRNRVAQLGTLAGLIIGGVILESGATPLQRTGDPLLAYALLFTLAGLCRFVSGGVLASQSEPPMDLAVHRVVSWRELVARFRHGVDGRLIAYMFSVQIATYVAAPFFVPFMLKRLQLSYLGFTTLTATALLTRIIVLPALGRIAHRFGALRLLCIGGVGIVPLALLWVFSGNFWYLVAIQAASGASWAAYELATLLLIFETVREHERTSIMTSYNVLNSLAIVLGSFIGGALLLAWGEHVRTYVAIFTLSTLARAATVLLLARVAGYRVGVPAVSLYFRNRQPEPRAAAPM